MTSHNLNICKKGDLIYITFPKFDATGLTSNCFTTRFGGVSTGHLSTMNMSFSPNRGDSEKNVLQNYKIICNALGVDYSNCVISHQTHTTNLRTITSDDIGKGITKPQDYEDIDGLITNLTGVTLVTLYADCVPLLFLDPEKRVIANSHAGWKGTVGEIGRLTVEKMKSDFGCNPENIIAAIGPSICMNCFEVDKPVYQLFSKLPNIKIQDICKPKDNGKYLIDLWEANRRILINAGIKPENIDITDLCTKCNDTLFFSHRKMGEKRGNLAAMICLKSVN